MTPRGSASDTGALRIEMIVPAMVAAGMEMVVARLTRRLTARGHDVGITCIEFLGDVGARLEREGIPIAVARSPGLRTLAYPHALTRRLRERRPHAVHVHSGAWLKGARAAACAKVPRVVHTEHGLLDDEPRYASILKRWAAEHSAAIAAVSQPVLTYLRDVDRIPPSKLHLIPNGIDSSVFRPDGRHGDLRNRFGLSHADVVIGHVARFDPVKNQKLLLGAFARLHSRRPETFLAMIGDGEMRPAIEQVVDQLGLLGRVGLYGLADDMPPLYREFDLFVLSSTAEGTSMSILEAMATGLPVVATSVGGNPALLGFAGSLVPPGDADAMAAAMERLVTSPQERRTLGTAARRRVEEHYDERGVADRYESLYRGGQVSADTTAPRLAG